MSKETESPQEATPESTSTKPEFTCIREGSAPKLRDQTQLIHYAIGKSNDVDVIQLVSNTNNGLFSDELIRIESIQQCLSGRGDLATFTSRIFHPLFRKSSNNNAGFLGAVLKHEGILKTADKKQFKHQLAINPDDILMYLTAADIEDKSN
ncbi:hypothetical protein [Moritella viscosa]|uniref:Uncharacterized protein n=1 Tax=Moritella viscosa TaxID=80854 RepID=A0A1L0ASZ5_9GAMM|nr:hypothetical protein [Moritella viscosa]SGZ20467.1 Putative uncharacterized protein [Moritella viscosa]